MSQQNVGDDRLDFGVQIDNKGRTLRIVHISASCEIIPLQAITLN